MEIAQLWRPPKRGFAKLEAGQRLRMWPSEVVEVESLTCCWNAETSYRFSKVSSQQQRTF